MNGSGRLKKNWIGRSSERCLNLARLAATAPNEKFSLTSFHGGTRSCAYLYEELARG